VSVDRFLIRRQDGVSCDVRFLILDANEHSQSRTAQLLTRANTANHLPVQFPGLKQQLPSMLSSQHKTNLNDISYLHIYT
jgi:hypothetical protein